MHRILTRGLMVAFLLAGCGSGSSGEKFDARPIRPPQQDTAIEQPIERSDAGCDEEVMGEDYCIKNPAGPPQGGGTQVARQNPVPYRTCKL
jgi:hypothetical protein